MSERFLPPITDGHQLFEATVDLAGIEHRREDVLAFIDGREHQLEFVREPDNPADANAIAVYGLSKGLLFSQRRKIGYVPADVAAHIARCGVFEVLRPRLRSLYVSDGGFCLVQFDITGPTTEHERYSGARVQAIVGSAVQDGRFLIPRDNVEKNMLGQACERSGETDKAIACCEACIGKGRFDGSFPYDRLLAIYRKQGRRKDELRVLRKAVRLFDRVATEGRSDGPSKAQQYRGRLTKLETNEEA